MSQLVTQEASSAQPADAATDYRAIATHWLHAFSSEAEAGNVDGMVRLLAADPWWRDIYALTWDLTGMHGADDIAGVLNESFKTNGLSNLALSDELEPGLRNDSYVEAIYTFETKVGRGRGVVRLVQEQGEWKAQLLSTYLESLKGFEPKRVTMDNVHDEEFNVALKPGTRKTAAELKEERVSFRTSDPSVLIIGAGHSGLHLAAYLSQLGVPTLVVERNKRVGDNWRLRYSGLILHDLKWAVQFPLIDFPQNFPVFIDKDLLGDWHETYANLLDLNVWTEVNVESAKYDEKSGKWTVELDHAGEHRTLRPNHLAIATGLNGLPKLPEIEGMSEFAGLIRHSAEYEGGDIAKGKRVVVVGAGSSGHDVAQDAYESGATSITMVQRSPTYVYSQARGVPIQFGFYYHDKHMPIETADLLASAQPTKLSRQNAEHVTNMIADVDRDLLEKLEGAGFKTWLGPEGKGLVPIASENAGSYYVDKGGSQLIIDGHIRMQSGEIARFTPKGVVYNDGTEEEADIVVLSTGFTNVRDAIRPIVGDDVADSLATVWHVDDRGEVRTALRHSGHPKLWFVANGLRISRILAKPLAVMIQAIDEGLLDPNISVEKKAPEPAPKK